MYCNNIDCVLPIFNFYCLKHDFSKLHIIMTASVGEEPLHTTTTFGPAPGESHDCNNLITGNLTLLSADSLLAIQLRSLAEVLATIPSHTQAGLLIN